LKAGGPARFFKRRAPQKGFGCTGHKSPTVLDLAMRTGALNGLSFIRGLRLHDQETPISVFTMHSDPVIVSRALELGAIGYLLRDAPSDEFIKAFKRVRDGRRYLSHDVAADVAFTQAREKTNPLRRLTLRELQTLALVAEGKPYGIVADHLNVSYKTVANTCTQLKSKLGAQTLPELMWIAIESISPRLRARAVPDRLPVGRLPWGVGIMPRLGEMLLVLTRPVVHRHLVRHHADQGSRLGGGRRSAAMELQWAQFRRRAQRRGRDRAAHASLGRGQRPRQAMGAA
jgi:DNA-binding NarL/FixJ family response regulator